MATWYATNDNDHYSTFGKLHRVWWTLWIMRRGEWKGTFSDTEYDEPYKSVCAEIQYRDPKARIVTFARRTRK